MFGTGGVLCQAEGTRVETANEWNGFITRGGAERK